MTQPQEIKAAADFCAKTGAIKFFDAGDVQANGFQIVEDDRPGETFTETGASYMGFAVSALLAGAIAEQGQAGEQEPPAAAAAATHASARQRLSPAAPAESGHVLHLVLVC